MPYDSLITIAIFIFVAVVIIASCVKTVTQGSEWTVERFGRYTKTLRPGLNLIVPFIDKVGPTIFVIESLIKVSATLSNL